MAIVLTIGVLWVFLLMTVAAARPGDFIYDMRIVAIYIPFVTVYTLIKLSPVLSRYKWYKIITCVFQGHIHPKQEYVTSALLRFPYPCDADCLRCGRKLFKNN